MVYRFFLIHGKIMKKGGIAMVQRFWKIFGWVCCILTILLFAAGRILCAGPAGAIQPEWFLHPVYSSSQWEVLTLGGEAVTEGVSGHSVLHKLHVCAVFQTAKLPQSR